MKTKVHKLLYMKLYDSTENTFHWEKLDLIPEIEKLKRIPQRNMAQRG